MDLYNTLAPQCIYFLIDSDSIDPHASDASFIIFDVVSFLHVSLAFYHHLGTQYFADIAVVLFLQLSHYIQNVMCFK